MAAIPSPRRTRPAPRPKRLATIRLSTDTTSSLPAYSSPFPPRPASTSQWIEVAHPLDEPPDYPQSAEEADKEDDFDQDYIPPRLPRSTSARKLKHRRGHSISVPTSPSVDDLLERSVVALELSTNALLQSINTQSSISAIANDQILERSLDRQTKMLDLRIRGSRNTHEDWMDDLDDVMKGVDGLLGAQPSADASISRSLPTGSHMPRRRQHHSHSGDLPKSRSESAHLYLSNNSEVDLRDSVRAPRALTQYVSVESNLGDAAEATADPDSIFLPSTMGLRSAAQIRGFGNNDTSPHRLRKTVSSPGIDLCTSSSTPAYTMLSSLATRQSSRSPCRTATPPTSQYSPSISDTTTVRTVRRHSASSLDSNSALTNNFRRSRSTSRGGGSAPTEATSLPPPPVRAMTPPMEEVTPSSSESEHAINAFRTVQSLRKILDESSDTKGKRPITSPKPPRHIFRPRTPSVAPSASTSMATASVYRLYTRSSHHASSSKPKHSSLKSSRSEPSNTLTAPGEPGTLTPASCLSSAPSTPRQVSFVEMPDTLLNRSGPESWKTKKRKDKGKGKAKKGSESDEAGWWTKWFSTSNHMASMSRYEEKIEDKMLRGWGRPGVGGGDEWML